jgi:hypothetical protein
LFGCRKASREGIVTSVEGRRGGRGCKAVLIFAINTDDNFASKPFGLRSRRMTEGDSPVPSDTDTDAKGSRGAVLNLTN